VYTITINIYDNEEINNSDGLYNFFNILNEIFERAEEVFEIPDWLWDPQSDTGGSVETITEENLNQIAEEKEEAIECSLCGNEESKCRELPCGHKFGTTCITRWLTEYSNTCPVCRETVS